MQRNTSSYFKKAIDLLAKFYLVWQDQLPFNSRPKQYIRDSIRKLGSMCNQEDDRKQAVAEQCTDSNSS